MICANDIERAYRNWLAENPQVFPLYERFAMEALRAGMKFSIALLTERIRWEVRMQWGHDKDGFKVNNNYRAYLARDLMERLPSVRGFLCTREVRPWREEGRNT